MAGPPLTLLHTLRPRPASLACLYWSLTALALQGFGGVVAVVQRDLVEKRRWLTKEEFVEDWSVAQILPGPNVVNLALMLGERYFGLRGALVAVAGMLSFPLASVLLLAALFSGVADLPVAQGAMRGLGAVVAGLIAATGLRLLGALRHNVMGLVACTLVCVSTFVAIALLRTPLVWVLLLLGGVAITWAWRQLARVETMRTTGPAP